MRGVGLVLVACMVWALGGCSGTDRKFGSGGGDSGGGAGAGVAGQAGSTTPTGGMGGTPGTGVAGEGPEQTAGDNAGGAGGTPDEMQGCTVDEFDAGTGCQALTTCDETEFEESPPKPDQDRVCAPLALCTATEYEKVPPTSTSNRVCDALTVCPAGTFVTGQAQPTSNRTCGPCATGTFSASLNADSCTAWAQCKAGETQSVAPSATSDRVCSSCGSGKYESGGGCLPLTVCKVSEYEVTPATATSDRKCKTITTCLAGTKQTAAPTATSDRQCAPCSSGTYSSQNNATACAAWTQCTAAQFESQAPSATQDRKCSALTTCTAGTRIKTAATATTDRECVACSSGTFTSTANQSSCQTWTTCSAGYYATGASSSSDRTCTPCASGTFSTTQNAATCKAWTTCTSSQTQSQAGTSTSDVVCVDKPVCSTAADRTCTTACPCASGEGVCTLSNQCVAGSSCVSGSGKKVGRAGDTCLATHCNDDKQDSGETSVDCGGECGCLATYEEVPITGVPAGALFFRVDAMSGDGTRLAGRTVRGKTHTAATITAAGALTELQSYGTFSQPVAMSVDGNVVVGSMYCANPPTCDNQLNTITRWTGSANPQTINQLEGPKGASSSGATIVGDFFNDQAGSRQGYIINGLQITYIPVFDSVSDVSPDGKYVAGSLAGSVQAGLWQASNQAVTKIGDTNWSDTYIAAVNGQTLVVAGQGTTASKTIGFRWKAGTLTTIPALPSGTSTYPVATSADGGTVVGNGDQGVLFEGFIWTDAGGTRLIVDELKARGYEPPVDLELNDTLFISNDGKIIVGNLPDAATGFWRVTLK